MTPLPALPPRSPAFAFSAISACPRAGLAGAGTGSAAAICGAVLLARLRGLRLVFGFLLAPLAAAQTAASLVAAAPAGAASAPPPAAPASPPPALPAAAATAAPRPPILGLWLMGQSLCDGSESLPLVTPADTGWGNLSFKRGVRTWLYNDHPADPAARAADQFSFIPLAAAANSSLGETMANGLADHLTATQSSFSSSSSRKPPPSSPTPPQSSSSSSTPPPPSTLQHSTAPPPQHSTSPSSPAPIANPPPVPHPTPTPYLVAYAGQGGRTIEELAIADLSTDPRTPKARQHGGGYYKTSLDDARRATAQARALGRAFRITALVWMQGEGNGGPAGGILPARWDPELPRPAGQEWYRDRLIAYRRQWSADLRAITGQPDAELPLFTYQTLGPAGEAQLMAADADPHITLVGPHYMVPSALNSRYGPDESRHGDPIHLSADGERWHGEQVAKVIHRVLHQGEAWQPLRPLAAAIAPDRASVLVTFHVPRPPLVLDTTFLPLQQVKANQDKEGSTFTSLAGFQVGAENGGPVPLTAITVEHATHVRIHFARSLPTGIKYHLSCGQPYAGQLSRIISIRPTPPPSSAPTTTTDILISSPPPPLVAQLLQEGAFQISNQVPGRDYAQAPIRAVLTETDAKTGAPITLLRYEDRELRNATPFAPGQTLAALRTYPYSNLRDSDPEPAVYTFTDPAYGRRQGQPYPLWNWCILFRSFPITDP